MSTCLPANFVNADPKTDLLIIPKMGSKVSSSFILSPSRPTVVADDRGSITIPILYKSFKFIVFLIFKGFKRLNHKIKNKSEKTAS